MSKTFQAEVLTFSEVGPALDKFKERIQSHWKHGRAGEEPPRMNPLDLGGPLHRDFVSKLEFTASGEVKLVTR